MSSRSEADLAYGTALFFSFFLLVLSGASFIALAEYVSQGEIYVSFGSFICIPVLLAVSVAACAINASVARTVITSSPDPNALRAAYLLIGYPIVMLSFLFATIGTSFAPSIAFGFPLFIAGTFLYPWASLIVRREFWNIISTNVLRVQCYKCRYVFEMNRGQDQIRCPYCGEPNLNPLGPDPDEPPAEEALDVEATPADETPSEPSMLTRF